MPGRPSKFQLLGPWFCSSSLDFGSSLRVLPGLGANKPFFFSFKALGVCFCHLSSKLSWLIYCRDCEPIPMKLERTAHFWDSLCEQSPDHIRKLLFGPARGLGFLVIWGRKYMNISCHLFSSQNQHLPNLALNHLGLFPKFSFTPEDVLPWRVAKQHSEAWKASERGALRNTSGFSSSAAGVRVSPPRGTA